MTTQTIITKCLICLLIILTNPISSKAQIRLIDKKTDLKLISDKIDKLIAKYNKPNQPGLAISVIKDGSIVYKKGIGTANLEYGIPITPSTVFHIASVSKQFTIFSILLLEQEGKLSIDDDIRKYLPEMTDYGHKITLRNLANHTSGIRDNTDLASLFGTSEVDMLSNEQVIKLITNQKGVNFIAGDEFEYCNSGYILLAEIVKRVSGKSLAEFTASRIFKPLNMKNSLFLDNPETIIKNKAYSYYQSDNVYFKNILNFSFVGSTGLNTTAEDLSLWAINFEKQSIGNNLIFNKMKEKGILNNGKTLTYAMGQEIKKYKGLNVIFHGGGDASYRSYLLRIPEHRLSIIVLSNSQSFNPLDISYDIVDFYLKDKETLTISKPIIDKSLLKNFIGDYEIFPGYIASIISEKDILFLQIKGETLKLKLPQTDSYEFSYPNLPHSRIVFSRTGEQITNSLNWYVSDFIYKGTRIELKDFDATKANIKDFIGAYYNPEINTTYNIIIKNTKIVATHDRNDSINLINLQPDIFISNRGFFGKLEFIRNDQNRITGFYLSGQKFRRIKFNRVVER